MRCLAGCAIVSLVLVAGCTGESPLEMLLLRPSATLEQTPLDRGYAYQEYTVPVAPDRSIVVWHVPAENSKGLVIVVPGCTDNKAWYLKALPVLVPHGYDVLLLDYEGFGNSPGTPSLQHTIDDALAVVPFAQTLHPKVFLFGVSLGAPLAARAAAEYDVAGLILEGSLILDWEPGLWLQQKNLGFPPIVVASDWFVQAQLPEGYDILKYVALCNEPKLIIHSVDDIITPFVSGQMVYDAAPEPKTFWQVHGGHGKMIDLEPELYAQTITGWMDGIVKE